MMRETYPIRECAFGLCATVMAASALLSTAAQADVIEIPIEDAMPTEFWSFGDFDTANPNGLFDLGNGSAVSVTGVGWELQVTATEPAMFSDLGLALVSASGPFDTSEGLFLRLFDGDDFSGTETYSTGGVVALADVGLPDIHLDNGMLYGELFTFVPGQEGLSVNGMLTIQYVIPAPGSLALLACAGLCGFKRRRR